MAKTYSRTVTVYIDGSKIDNSIPAIQKKVRELTRDVKKMTIGTDEYNKTVKSIAELNSILAEHKKAVRGVAEETETLGERLGGMADFFNKLRKLYAERKGITDAYGSDLEKDAVGSQSSSTFTNNPASAQSGLGRPSKAQPSHKGTSKPDPEVVRQKRVQKQLDSITADYESKRTQAKQAYLDGTIATQEDYNRRIEDLELEELNKKLEVAGLEPKKRAEIEKKILDYKVKLYDQLREIEQSFGDTEEERLAHELDTIKQKYDQDLALLDNLHDKQLVSEEQYQQDLKRLKERYDNDKQKANRESADRVISDAKKTFDELMESQRKANIKNGRIDEQSQTDRLEAWQGYLQKLLDKTSLSAEQRAAIQQQIDDAEVEQTEETLKKKQELAQKYNDIVCETIVSSGQKLGEELGKVLQGEQANFKDFLRGILSLMIDALEKAAVGSFDTGGFTPSGAWDKPQGIVHSNEFVANRFATANPAVRPVLNLINEAQRSGSVSRLSADDIAAVVPTTQYQPSTSPHGSGRLREAQQGLSPESLQSSALTSVLSRVVRTLTSIDRRFSSPIVAETYATGKHGTIEAERLVNKMKSNVSRKRK